MLSIDREKEVVRGVGTMKWQLVILAAAVVMLGLLSGCGDKTAAGAARKAGLDFGFAVSIGDMASEGQRQFVKENCSVMVAENCMKMESLRPNRRFWNWADIDQFIRFAEENKIAVKYHVLIWHQQNSAFVNQLSTREDALGLMDEYIPAVMEHCKGKVKYYDVVNEMFNEDGSRRESVWQKLIGSDYIEYALRLARKYDADAKLYLNDYNNENKGYAKADAMYELAKDLVERGVPLDGIGMQLHLAADAPYDENAIRENVKRYAELGLEVSFSEVDVRLPVGSKEQYEEAQMDIYLSLLKIALEEPNVKSFIIWGISDKNSWVPRAFGGYGDALPFDAQYNAKPFYKDMIEMIRKHR